MRQMCLNCFGKGHSEEPPSKPTPSHGDQAPLPSYPMNNRTQRKPQNTASQLSDKSSLSSNEAPNEYIGSVVNNEKIFTGATCVGKPPRKLENHQIHNDADKLPSHLDETSNSKPPKEGTNFEAQNEKLFTPPDEHSKKSEKKLHNKKSNEEDDRPKQPPKEETEDSRKASPTLDGQNEKMVTRADQPSSKLDQHQLSRILPKEDSPCSDNKKSNREPLDHPKEQAREGRHVWSTLDAQADPAFHINHDSAVPRIAKKQADKELTKEAQMKPLKEHARDGRHVWSTLDAQADPTFHINHDSAVPRIAKKQADKELTKEAKMKPQKEHARDGRQEWSHSDTENGN